MLVLVLAFKEFVAYTAIRKLVRYNVRGNSKSEIVILFWCAELTFFNGIIFVWKLIKIDRI